MIQGSAFENRKIDRWSLRFKNPLPSQKRNRAQTERQRNRAQTERQRNRESNPESFFWHNKKELAMEARAVVPPQPRGLSLLLISYSFPFNFLKNYYWFLSLMIFVWVLVDCKFTAALDSLWLIAFGIREMGWVHSITILSNIGYWSLNFLSLFFIFFRFFLLSNLVSYIHYFIFPVVFIEANQL